MDKLYRPHRGSLDDAMKEVRKVDSANHLVEIVRESLVNWYPDANIEEVVTVDTLRSKHTTYDERIGWDTHLLCLDGWGVIGQLNFDFEQEKKKGE